MKLKIKKFLLFVAVGIVAMLYFPFLLLIVAVGLPIVLVFRYDITNTKPITTFIAPLVYLDEQFGKMMTSPEEREALRRWDEKYEIKKL
jgi:hypothetical protein